MSEQATPKCDQEVYDNGDVLAVVAMSSAEAEAECIKATARTGMKHDWHHSMGRVVIKRLFPSQEQLSLAVKEITNCENSCAGWPVLDSNHQSVVDRDIITIHTIKLTTGKILVGSSVSYAGEEYDEASENTKARLNAVNNVDRKSIEDVLEKIRIGMITETPEPAVASKPSFPGDFVA